MMTGKALPGVRGNLLLPITGIPSKMSPVIHGASKSVQQQNHAEPGYFSAQVSISH